MILDIVIISVLLVLGVILMLTEFFVIPGVSIAGIGSAVSFLGGIIYAFIHLGNTVGIIIIAIAIVLVVSTVMYVVKSNAMDRIALKSDVGSTVDQTDFLQVQVGDKGTTASRMNPRGKVNIGDITVEAKSITGEFIQEHEMVEVLRVENGTVFVQHITK